MSDNENEVKKIRTIVFEKEKNAEQTLINGVINIMIFHLKKRDC